MRVWNKALAAAAAIMLRLGAAQAQATTINWTLSDGTFDDGGAFWGTFAFNVESDTITDWNVTTTLEGGSPFPTTYAPGCFVVFCNAANDNGSGPTFVNGFSIFSTTFKLTNIPMSAPGTVAHLTGDESDVSLPFPFVGAFSRTVTDGQAVGALAPVLAAPEPTAWALMIGGFGLAGSSLRARRRAALAQRPSANAEI